ncbi:unnamed protein product [Pedinophyceae sp. YPF-701]|nr:unnamed protein product [Pedinophyceae sp. YPF-701]
MDYLPKTSPKRAALAYGGAAVLAVLVFVAEPIVLTIAAAIRTIRMWRESYVQKQRYERGETIYMRLGGPGPGDLMITRLVDHFYLRVLKDARLAEFFSTVDMRRQRMHQRRFITLILGGPRSYKGKGLSTAHAYMRDEQGLCERHFEYIMEHLLAALTKDLDFQKDMVEEIIAKVMVLKNQVLGYTNNGIAESWLAVKRGACAAWADAWTGSDA